MSVFDQQIRAGGLYAWREADREEMDVYEESPHNRHVITVKRQLTQEELEEFAAIWAYAYECGQKDIEGEILRNLRGR